MNLFKSFKSSQSGFTLIELLVVIGILGVLAAALVATIDPFEQLKKAQDANVKNTAVEFVNANIRYYTTHNALPWANGVSNCSSTGSVGSSSNIGCVGALIDDGELKSGFTTVSTINSVIFTGTSNSVVACFQPQSKSQWRDPNTKYSSAGIATTGCISQTSAGVTTCYWCAQ